MKTLVRFSAFWVCTILTGCGGGSSPNPPMPAAMKQSVTDVIRPGDKITIRLTGVPAGEYFNEVQVPASGDVTVPILTQSFHAAGRNAADLGAEISDAYKSQKIYTNPVVIVLPEERFVNVGGDVRGPSRVAYSADATVMSTINSCGGFTEYANRRHVRIIRGSQVIEVDCVRAASDPGADPSVFPGDQIYVPRTIL